MVRDGQALRTGASIEHEGRRIQLVTTVAHYDDLGAAGRALARLLDRPGDG